MTSSTSCLCRQRSLISDGDKLSSMRSVCRLNVVAQLPIWTCVILFMRVVYFRVTTNRLVCATTLRPTEPQAMIISACPDTMCALHPIRVQPTAYHTSKDHVPGNALVAPTTQPERFATNRIGPFPIFLYRAITCCIDRDRYLFCNI